jgi:hypothetical protein
MSGLCPNPIYCDGSTLSLLAASYDVADAWTLRAYVSANIGGRRSERGSAPRAIA